MLNRLTDREHGLPTGRRLPRRRRVLVLASATLAAASSAFPPRSCLAEKMQVGFLWHMHQPIYYPGESITQTDADHRFSYSVTDIHNQRFGPYTTWPRDAIQSGLALPNLGAQVSFSGTLIENLNNLQAAGVNGGMWNNWKAGYQQARGWNTAEGNPRLDLIGFSYDHALMPLLDVRDMRIQIQMHKAIVQQQFGSNVPYSTGFFPAETAFSERMIPALVAEGFQYSLVDNIHFDRATKNYPHTNSSGLFAPNKADQINPDPAASGGAWIQLNNVWAPSKVSAPFSYRPHNVQYVDPNTGATSKIVAVPAARYEGNEDGRGGFGALQYQTVMDQYRQYNTDPSHPMYVMLHHDGDNYGGGSDSYYHSNFTNMVNWANGNANYNVTTVADYLKKFPVASNDVIHVENGSWAGADNGDPEFKKWLGDPNASGWSPDRNSWAVLTAAKNRVYTAEDITPITNVNNVINGTGNATEKAWHYLSQGMASDHWYWDGTEVWDSNVTRASNLAVQQANQVINGFAGVEHTAPSVFVPQRDSYNPGAYEFGSTPEPSDFRVWTYAYDVSGLTSVTLKWRADVDGENPLSSTQNETYAGGSEVGAWQSASMTSSDVTPPANILAAQYRALQYSAMITGQTSKLIDYYVEAVDAKGNVTKTDIQHVWVGPASTPNPDPSGFTMDGVRDADTTEIAANNGMHLYFGRKGTKMYLATNDAGEGSDHFILVAKNPGAMRAAPWAKAGQVAQWDAFLADENDNNYSGWFDAAGANQSATGTNGGVLEGTLDLVGEFGYVPSELYLAVAIYSSPDGGALVSTHQIAPTLDSDGNVQPGEFFRYQIAQGWVGVGTNNNWSTPVNWTDASVPNSVGATARLGDFITAPGTVTLDAPVTVGKLTFDNTFGYTISGINALTIDVASGSGTISVVKGNHSIAAPVVLNDDVVVDVQRAQDKLTISNLQPTTGAITKQGPGALEVNRLRAGALSITSGTVTISSSGGGGGGAGSLGLLSVSPGATLDLTDNDLLLTSTPKSSVESHVSSKRLTTSLATPTSATGLGVLGGNEYLALGTASFDGVAVAPSDVLIKYTYYGDANFDGRVTFDDYVKIDTGFNTHLTGWLNGDFNYSGAVNFDDYVLIDIAFNQQNGTLSRAVDWISGDDRSGSGRTDFGELSRAATGMAEVIAHLERFGASYGAAFLAAVPEPSMLLALGAPVVARMSLRRRRR